MLKEYVLLCCLLYHAAEIIARTNAVQVERLDLYVTGSGSGFGYSGIKSFCVQRWTVIIGRCALTSLTIYGIVIPFIGG